MLRKIWKFEEEEKLSQLGFISLAVIEVFEGNWLLIFFQIGDFTKNKEHFLVSFQGLPPRRWQSSKNFDFSEGVLHFNPVWWDNSIEGKLLRRKFLSRAFFFLGVMILFSPKYPLSPRILSPRSRWSSVLSSLYTVTSAFEPWCGPFIQQINPSRLTPHSYLTQCLLCLPE